MSLPLGKSEIHKNKFGRAKARVVFVVLGIALAAGVLAPGHGAHAAIAFVQENATDARTAGSNSTAFNSSNTPGDLIVVAVNWDTISANVTSVVDTNGNTYASAVGPVDWDGSPPADRMQVFYAKIRTQSYAPRCAGVSSTERLSEKS